MARIAGASANRGLGVPNVSPAAAGGMGSHDPPSYEFLPGNADVSTE